MVSDPENNQILLRILIQKCYSVIDVLYLSKRHRLVANGFQ